MLYFIQGNAYRIFGEPLIKENFEAWQYGPVESSLYRQIGARGITPLSENDIISRDVIDPSHHAFSWLKVGISVLERYTASELVRNSHAKNTPWDIIWKKGEGRFEVIPKELISIYFKNR